jgi:hypothetical protein
MAAGGVSVMRIAKALALLLSVAAGAFASSLEFSVGRQISIPELRPTSGAEVPWVPLATNGANLFTAWVTSRNGDTAVFGARLSLQGRTLDSLGLRLVGTDASYGRAAVVWNGSEYVTFAPSSAGIVVARVRDDGSVVGTRQIAEPGVFMIGDAIWNGSHYALLIREGSENGTVAKLLIASSDFAIEKSRQLNDATFATGGAALATDGINSLLVWETFTATSDVVRAQRLDDAGAPLGGPQTVPTGAETDHRSLGNFWPAVAWNGISYTIVWMSSGIAGVTFSTPGTFGVPFRVTNEQATFPSIAWNGHEHLVTWTHMAWAADGDFHLDGARMSSSGAVISSTTLSASNVGEAQAALSGFGSGFIGVWLGDIFGGVGHAPLTSRYYDQGHPLLAASQAHVLAFWGEAGGIYAGRLDLDGAPLDGGGLRIAPPARSGDMTLLLALSNGDVDLVAWTNAANEIRIQRLTAERTLLDPGGGTLLTANGWNPSMVGASDGKNFLLVWTQWPFGGGPANLVSVMIAPRGPITTAPHAMAPSTLTQFPRALVWNGSTYSLIWDQGPLPTIPCFLCTTVLEQRISLVDGSGNLLGQPVIGDAVDTIGAQRAGSELLVAFSSGGSTYTRRFTFSGDPLAKAVAVLSLAKPSVLAPAPDGFALLYQAGANEIDAVLLDDRGNEQSEPGPILRSKGSLELDAAVFANTTTWLAYTTPIPVDGEPQTARRALTSQLKRGREKRRMVSGS